jgi:outer membrane protein assembly factor BamB
MMKCVTRWLLPALALACASPAAPADDWPQWLGPKRDGVWREKGILDKFPKDGPKEKWRVKVGWGYAGPAVADGRVYLLDFVPGEETDLAKQNGFKASSIKGKERVLCLDAESGKELWKHEDDITYTVSYPGGPRCTPTVHDGKVYALGAQGHLTCLDAKKGDVVWEKEFTKDYGAKTAIWGYASHPLVDGKRLICVVGGKDSLAVAFDKDSGKELWKSLDAPPQTQGYCPPTLIDAGGKKQVVIWDAEKVHGIDPETGKPVWSVGAKPNFGMAIAAPRQSGDQVLVSGYDTAVLLKFEKDKAEPKEVWRGKASTAVYAINATPVIDGDMIYGVDQPGPLRGVKLETGERVWEAVEPVSGTKRPQVSATVFLVKNGDRYFLFNEKGELIIAKLTPKGYEEIDKRKLLDPTNEAFGRPVVWSHPAFANKCIFARNDKEIVCASLAAE